MMMSQPVTTAVLRQFGWQMAIAWPLLFCGLLPWLFSTAIPYWPLGLGLVFLVFGLLLPAYLKPVYWLWMRLTGILGWINTRIILAILFYLVLTPVGLVARWWGRLDYKGQCKKDVTSYWRVSEPGSATQMKDPF